MPIWQAPGRTPSGVPTSPTARRPSSTVNGGRSEGGDPSNGSRMSRRQSRAAAPSAPPGMEALHACYGRRFSYAFYKNLVRAWAQRAAAGGPLRRAADSVQRPPEARCAAAAAAPRAARPCAQRLTCARAPPTVQALVLTFLTYALFHATRKPPSVVKRCARRRARAGRTLTGQQRSGKHAGAAGLRRGFETLKRGQQSVAARASQASTACGACSGRSLQRCRRLAAGAAQDCLRSCTKHAASPPAA